MWNARHQDGSWDLKWWRWTDWLFVAIGVVEFVVALFIWANTGDWGRGLFLLAQSVFLPLLALHNVSQRYHVDKLERVRDDFLDSLQRAMRGAL